MTEPVTAPHVVGVDLSLTATGLAWPDGHTMTHGRSGLSTITSVTARVADLHTLGGELYARIVGRTYLGSGRPDLVVMESLIKRGGAAGISTEKAYVWWTLVRMLSLHGVSVMEASVSTGKQYLTGHGDGNKREMVDAVKRHFPAWEIRKTGAKGRVLTTDDENKADAVAFMALGCHLLGHPLVDLPAQHLKALDKLALPEGVRR
jgi:Holliday junction resolvasome RuvABC endonuclease subunit